MAPAPWDFRLSSGTRRDGVWQTKEPLKLPELGTYRIDVDVTDADGERLRKESAGDLAYYSVAWLGECRSQLDRPGAS